MSITKPNFGQYASDIMEYGAFKHQTEAAKAMGISPQLFNMVLTGARRNPSWTVGHAIIVMHGRVMADK